MKVQFPEDIRIFVACGQTDMRKSIDGLSAIVSRTYRHEKNWQNLGMEIKRSTLSNRIIKFSEEWLSKVVA